jgi:NTE family protein
MSLALVLGGGGVTGIAWELGVLLGLRDEGVDVTGADLVVGTSAGAAVAGQLHALDLADLFARQLDPEHHEIAAILDLRLMATIFGELMAEQPPSQVALAKVGAHALAATTVSEADRHVVIEHRLPSHEWPERALKITAVDAATGAFVAFDAASGVTLVDAVAASCAVPGVWPPVTIGGARYIDGGVRSPTCCDLAAGYDQVVVLAPLTGPSQALLQSELDALAPASIAVVLADEAATAAIGPNPLDPAARPPAAEAGRRQGREAAPEVAAALG